MAKQLAIEWDDKEIRVVAAQQRGDRFAVTDVLSIDICGAEPDEIGTKLAEALTERGLSKLPTLVAIGRARAELRQLTFPAIPDDELPEVVRFQSVRQFAAAGERAAIDYLPIARSETGVVVAAAAVAPEHVDVIRKICAAADLQLQRIVLRPAAAAALFQLNKDSDSRETILIDTLADEFDLIVMRGGTPAFLRSVRVPAEPEARRRTIVGEVRRSLMAVRRDEGESNERRIIVWGRAEVHAQLLEALSESLKIPAESIDPFELVETPKEIYKALPSQVGRFAPLLGLLEGNLLGGEGLIDFLNPRKRPEPKSNRERYMLYGGLAAACVLLLSYLGWSQLADLDSKLKKAQTASHDLEEAVKAASVSKADLARIDQFLDGDVFTLGELAYVSKHLAPAESMQVKRLTVAADPRGGAIITLIGAVNNSAVVTKTEENLRDSKHEVTGDGVKSDPRGEKMKYTFNETISISAASIREQRMNTPPLIIQETSAADEAVAETAIAAEITEDAEITEVTDAANQAETKAKPAEASVEAQTETKPAEPIERPAETTNTPPEPAELATEDQGGQA